MNKRIHIYAIWFPTSKKYYVGQTCNLDRRMQGHLRSGSIVCKALWKYDDWQVSILHTVKDRDAANLIEIEEIRNHNCSHPNGYNLTRGGDENNGFEGHHHTEKTLNKMSESQKKIQKEAQNRMEVKLKRSNSLLGNKNGIGGPGSRGHHWNLSERTKDKMRRAKIGVHWKCSEKARQNMSKAREGNQNAKGKNIGKLNCAHRLDVKYKHLKTRLRKLEAELC